MKKISLTILLIQGLITLTFCQNPTDSSAFQYYKFLTKQQIEVSLKITRLGNYLIEYSEMAEKCDSFKLGRERFDTLTELFHTTATMVNKAIFDIIDLQEVDSSIGLKDPVLFLLRGYNKILSEYFPIFLALLQNKGKVYTPDQTLTLKNTYKRYNTLLKDLNSHTEVIEAASYTFREKYKFTEYDVMKNGL